MPTHARHAQHARYARTLCMHARMHAMHARTHARTHARAHAQCTHAHTHNARTQARTHACTRVRTRIRTLARTCIGMHAHMHTCMHASAHARNPLAHTDACAHTCACCLFALLHVRLFVDSPFVRVFACMDATPLTHPQHSRIYASTHTRHCSYLFATLAHAPVCTHTRTHACSHTLTHMPQVYGGDVFDLADYTANTDNTAAARAVCEHVRRDLLSERRQPAPSTPTRARMHAQMHARSLGPRV